VPRIREPGIGGRFQKPRRSSSWDVISSGRIALDHLRVFSVELPKFDGLAIRAPESGGNAMWDVGIHMTD
jgi:hypothetical protein